MADFERINAIYREIGTRVKAAREKNGLTQDALSSRVGTSRASVALIERGNQRPPIDRLYRIADVLACEIADLLPPVRDFFSKKEEGKIRFDESEKDLSQHERKAIEAILKKNTLGD